MHDNYSYYEILGVPRDSSQTEIQRAFEELTNQNNRNFSENPVDTSLISKLELAYDVLSDPLQRLEYDRTLSHSPEIDHSLIDIQIEYSRNSVSGSQDDQLVYALVELGLSSGSDLNSREGLPRNIALVLDSSTSMKGPRLDIVKDAAVNIIQHLKPEDMLSVIQFSDRARVIVPAGPRKEIDQIIQDIQMMDASGGTEIYKGLQSAFNEVRQYLNQGFNSHMILITDGRTYGDEDACIFLAESAAMHGVSISGLGIGSEWNDAFIDELAQRTGGSSRYISNPHDIKRFLFEKFQGFEDAVLNNVSLDFKLGDSSKMTYAFRIDPEPGLLPTTSPIRLGSLMGEQDQELLIEFTIDPVHTEVEQVKLFDGRLTFAAPNISQTPYQMPFTLEIPVSVEPDDAPPSDSVVQAMSRLTLYRLQERAKIDVQEGRIDEAARRFQNLATHLLARGEGDLAKTVLMEANHLEQQQTLSEKGSKDIKYGTRNLVMPEETGKESQ